MTDGKQNRMSAASARGGRRVGMLSEEIAVGSGVMLCTSVNMRHMGCFFQDCLLCKSGVSDSNLYNGQASNLIGSEYFLLQKYVLDWERNNSYL